MLILLTQASNRESFFSSAQYHAVVVMTVEYQGMDWQCYSSIFRLLTAPLLVFKFLRNTFAVLRNQDVGETLKDCHESFDSLYIIDLK